MNMKFIFRGFINNINIILCFSIFLLINLDANACSRFTYSGSKNTVVVGRSMDWYEDVHTDLWFFPAGITKSGSKGVNAVKWKSKYSSIVASGYDVGVADGVNTEGLDANLLYLASTDYGKPKANKKNLSVLSLVPYVLDNYATVAEAVADFSENKFNMVDSKLPNGVYLPVHLSITDKTGDNAIFEFINGELVVHHGKKYNVMTNEPAYDKQLAFNEYWQNKHGQFLPGTGEPEDRFVRASYYVDSSLKTSDLQKSIATAFSIIRNVSVPIQYSSSSRPNVSPTIWRSVTDLKNKVYYFESVDKPSIFWVALNKLNLDDSRVIKKLSLQHGESYSGEVSKFFVKSNPPF